MNSPSHETSPSEDGSPTTTDCDDLTLSASDILTPSSATSEGFDPVGCDVEGTDEITNDAPKKKKKKKPKKSIKAKANAARSSPTEEDRPPVLCISRNKHWRYISSYHGPWLQLPLELLESLSLLNLDPATLTASEARLPQLDAPLASNSKQREDVSYGKQRDRGFHALTDHSPLDSPRGTFSTLPLTSPIPPPMPGKTTPPPIDPGVFRNVTSIRRLIDEAAELSVRASSGLSAAELGSLRGGSNGIYINPWVTSQPLGFNAFGQTNGGRNVAMSAMRVHRLRALAVQKLAQAYKADEIASSVMVMQGGSVFDDVAERVLKVDPNDIDAKYVHFFHEKIPSRQLAESTTTQVLDELISAQPNCLEFYRTRGIVHCFRDEYPQAARDFTHALREARGARKAKTSHLNHVSSSDSQRVTKNGKRRKGSGNKTNGQAPPSGTSVNAENSVEGPDGETLFLHPSVLPSAPDPIEPQVLFLRGASYLQHAVFLIEAAILELEGVRKAPTVDGAELRLCYIENGKYGGVEIGNPDGPLGKPDGPKAAAYSSVLAKDTFKGQIISLLRKSIRDHERFLAHFDTLESVMDNEALGDLAKRTEYAFLLTEAIRPGNHGANVPPIPDGLSMFTTYHPLLVESHFSILLCLLMLGEFVQILPTFIRTATLVDGLEGYPVFLPPRSMAQAEFVEILERLAGGWRHGIQPHSFAGDGKPSKGRLAIEPPSPMVSHPPSTSSSSVSEFDPLAPSSSSSTVFPPLGCPTELTDGQSNGTSRRSTRQDALVALDCARILLAPVVKRQRQRAEKAAQEKAAGAKKKPLSINIPLHGPRVEVMLAWLAAVHLPELEL
ncbi:hypothetical protein PLEOSDRAFT_1054549 [Pleurotus ostreatus PC15]|uniref:Uncharacterized protein n=1 Tax=Pleurotus ostreatus (strain PC15) TaxID=1137138 RepID=A0A067NU93_PLEO1|nr:hypothetical protein PLEOSDRAFT_1054549 [Pleurotus ostreatus PC15]